MTLARRAAWILFLMALPGLLLAMRLKHWKKQQRAQACASQLARLHATPVPEGLTKRDTLARELAALRSLGKREGDRRSRRCRKRLVLLPDRDQVLCLKHGQAPDPAPPPATSPQSGWLASGPGSGRPLELARMTDQTLPWERTASAARPRPAAPLEVRCGSRCAVGPAWPFLILGACLAYAWMLLRALRALGAGLFGLSVPEPSCCRSPIPPPRAPPTPTRVDGLPPLIGT